MPRAHIDLAKGDSMMKQSPEWSIPELGETVWEDFAMEDHHMISAQGYEVLNTSSAPCQDKEKSQIDFGIYNYAVDNLIPAENDHISVAKDFNFHDWPGIENCDIGGMFRYCDSTLGQSHLNYVDELSWLQYSSDAADGSEASYPSVLLSSPELHLLNENLEDSCANIEDIPKYSPPTIDVASGSVGCYSGSFACRNDAELGSISLSKKQAGCQNSLEDGTMRRWIDQNPLQCFSEENHFLGFSSSNTCSRNHASRAQVDYSIPAEWTPQAQSTSPSYKFDNENHPMTFNEQFARRAHQVRDHLEPPVPSVVLPDITMDELPEKQSYAPLLMEHSNHNKQINKSSVLNNHIESRKAIASAELNGVPVTGINPKITQHNTLLTCVSSDVISTEAISFQQLWHVMHQLDDRTKLLIRDGLYRLASSSKKRNVFSGRNCGSEIMNVGEILGVEALNQCNMETETSAVDRSIAHLLFQWP